MTIIDRLRQKKEAKAIFYIIHRGVKKACDIGDLFYGAGVFVTSSGPSMATADLEALKQPGLLRFGLNNSPSIIRPHLWTCMDTPGKFLESVWRDPAILKFCGEGQFDKSIQRTFRDDDWRYCEAQIQDCPAVVHMRRNNRVDSKAWLAERSINWGNDKFYGGGRTVMMAVLKICYLLGIKRVYLNGVDFRMSSEYTYAFNEQRAAGAVHNNNTTYKRFLAYATSISHLLAKSGMEIINCTPRSELTLFPFMPLQAAIARELRDFPNPDTEITWGRYLPNEAKKITPEDKKRLEELHDRS